MADDKDKPRESGKPAGLRPAPWNAPTARQEGSQGRTAPDGEAGDGRVDSSDPKMHAARF